MTVTYGYVVTSHSKSTRSRMGVSKQNPKTGRILIAAAKKSFSFIFYFLLILAGLTTVVVELYSTNRSITGKSDDSRANRKQTSIKSLIHLPLHKMAAILTDYMFKCIFLKGNDIIPIQISLAYSPFFLWKCEPENTEEISGLPTSRPLSNFVCLRTITSEVESAWWLLMVVGIVSNASKPLDNRNDRTKSHELFKMDHKHMFRGTSMGYFLTFFNIQCSEKKFRLSVLCVTARPYCDCRLDWESAPNHRDDYLFCVTLVTCFNIETTPVPMTYNLGALALQPQLLILIIHIKSLKPE